MILYYQSVFLSFRLLIYIFTRFHDENLFWNASMFTDCCLIHIYHW